MQQFKLTNKTLDFELSYGSYQIYFTGGWYIKNLEELEIELIDVVTKKEIILRSKKFFGLRKQDIIGKQKAVLAYEFDVLKYSKLRITINNPEILILKKMHPFMWMHSLLFPKDVALETILVVIK